MTRIARILRMKYLIHHLRQSLESVYNRFYRELVFSKERAMIKIYP